MTDEATSRSPWPAGGSTWLRRGLVAAALLLAAAPLLFHALRLDDYGRMQRDDYYGLLSRLTDGESFEDSIASFWNARINQHRVTVPALIWRTNVALTGGDNRPTAYLALAFLLAVFALCLWQARSEPGDRRRFLLGAPLLAWALIGPQTTYNLAKSFGGVHYFLSDLFCLGALAVLLRMSRPGRRRAGLLALGLLGILTFSSALAVWPALLLGCLWLRRPAGDAVTVLLGAATSAAVFRSGLGGKAEWPSPATLLEYLAVFLGALPRQGVETARLLGAAGLLLFAVLTVLLWRRRDRGPDVFWLLVATYAAGNGLLAGLGRAGAGVEQAMAIRYVLFPGLFWASLFMLALSLRPSGGLPAHAVTLAVVATAVLGLRPAALEGLQHSRVFLESGRWQKVVEAQLRHHAWDPPLVGFAVTHFPPAVLSPARIELWTRLGHVPFDRPPESPPDRRFDPAQLGEPSEGAFTEIVETTDPDIVRVVGWIPRDAGIREVVFTDNKGRQRSIVHLWPHPSAEDRLQWAGLVLWSDGWKTWTPFAVDAGGMLRPLAPARPVASRWRQLEQKRRTAPGPRATPRSPPGSVPTADRGDGEAPPG